VGVIGKAIVVAQVFACAVFAAPKITTPPSARASNMQVEMSATLYVDRAAIQQLLGSDLGGFYVVVDVRLASRDKEKLKVFRDDFQLRTDRDGERSKPFAPSQIAGRGALVITRTYDGGGIAAENGGPVFGGGIGGMGGGGIGNAGGTISNTTRVDSGAKNKEDPLLGVLKEKVLPEKETDQPVSGLLFFPMDPKQKAKDLELTYAGPGSRLTLRFR
jgi:hypothetical protein